MRHGWMALLALLALAACDDRGAGETSGTDCADGVDDDGDGLVDCADPGCSAHAWCGGVDRDAAGTPIDAGPPTDAGPRPDTGPVAPCSDPIDVVFTVDVSTSMEDEVASIRSGIDSIWTATQALTSNSRFSLIVFVDGVQVVNGCTPFSTREAMQTELAEWQAFTSSNQQPMGGGSNSDCAENSLDAIYASATQCAWRTGSLRILIHVTDDTFAERPTVLSEDPFLGGGVAVMRTYDEVRSAVVTQQIRIGAFAAPGAGEPCGAGTSPNTGQGFHSTYMGMPSLTEATGGRAWSIREVRAGTLDMAEAINAFTADEYCTLF